MHFLSFHISGLSKQITLAILASLIVVTLLYLLKQLNLFDLFNYFVFKKVKKLKEKGAYDEAGQVLETKKLFDLALQTYDEGKRHDLKAKLYLKLNKPEKAAFEYLSAKQYDKAVDILMALNEFNRVERILLDIGRHKEYGELLFRVGQYEKAAKAFMKEGMYESSTKALLKSAKPLEAAIHLEKAYLESKQTMLGLQGHLTHPETKRLGQALAKLFFLNGQIKKASRIYLELHEHIEAAKCFAQLGDYAKAATLCEDASDLMLATQYWIKAGNTSQATKLEGERLANRGELLSAIEKFIQSQDYARAGDLYCQLHETSKAAAMYEKANDHSLAGMLYRQAGQHAKAAGAFEEAKEYEKAIDAYMQAAQFQKEFQLRKKTGDKIGLARRYIELKMFDLALEVLDEFKEDHIDYPLALTLLGKIHIAKGEEKKAEKLFSTFISKTKTMDKTDVERMSQFAKAMVMDEPKSLQIFQDQWNKQSEADNTKQYQKLFHNALPSLESVIPQSNPMIQNADQNIRYIKIEEVGRGGMGVVFKARDSALDRIVALKVLPPALGAQPQAVQTFLREARSAAALNHPNIVIVYDTGIQEGSYHISMEYIEGHTVKQTLALQKKFNLQQALNIAMQVTNALDYAHNANIVHRDLTTSNIMLTKDNKAKIMDFGLAKVMKELLVEQSIIGGTPSFMSPEQTLGDPIDHRTDVYSFGICLFEMLTGQLPFQKGDLGYHHLHTPAPNPKEIENNIPDVLSNLILKCMEKKPQHRFQSIREIQDILKTIQE